MSKDNLTERKIKILKGMAYNMRAWLKDYSGKIFPDNKINISKGLDIDSPKALSQTIFPED